MTQREWTQICEEFCRQKLKAELLFANADNLDFGCQFPNGHMAHLDIHYIEDYFKQEENNEL